MSEQQKSRQEEYAEQIAQELIERLQQGTAPFQRLWEPSMGRDFPHNPVSGNEYSGLNVLRLMLQGRSDPRWMTYKQAASVNAQVRKGERGVGLVRLITHVERVKKDEHGKTVLDENGELVKERHALEQPYFKGFTVFNAEQIDGLPELKQAEPVWANHERAEKLLTASGAVIRHGGNDAYYSPKRDEIVLPKKEQFAGQGEYYAVALHELGHWSGHESRLNRDLSGRFGSEAYAREELRAEIASLMLTRELGLPHNPDRHAHYVGSWIKVLSEEPMEILKATQDAGRIKGFVLGFEQQIETERNALQRPSEPHQADGYSKVLSLPDFALQGKDKTAFEASWLRAVAGLPAAIASQQERLSAAGLGEAGLTAYLREEDGKDGNTDKEALRQQAENITRHIERLRDGQIKPSDYIGCGYKNPRQTAFEAMARDMVVTQAVLSPHIPYYDNLRLASYLNRQRQTPQTRPTEGQSLSERFQTAKQEYEQLLAKGTDVDREFGRFMEAGMEALIKGLPEQTQLQARTNFYETQISRINAKSEPEQTPEQQELFAGR